MQQQEPGILIGLQLMVSYQKGIGEMMCYSSAKVTFVSNLSSAVQSSLSINEGSSPSQGFLYLTVFVQTVGYRVLILLINERVTAPRVKCFFTPLSASVLSNRTTFNLYPMAPFVHIPGNEKEIIVLLFLVKTVSFATRARVMPRENCDLTVSWKGGCYRTLNQFLQSSSLPHMCYLHVQKGGYICKNPHFYSLTAKCTAHKCSSSVSYVYLI